MPLSLVNLRITAFMSDASGWESSTPELRFPTQLHQIGIHVPSEPSGRTRNMYMGTYYRTLRSLWVLTDTDRRVSLLLPLDPSGVRPVQETMATWKASVAGIPWW